MVGHGQMAEKELEKVMLDFMHGEANLLLVHHHHRERPRHPQRQHPDRQPRRHLRARRSSTSCAAGSGAPSSAPTPISSSRAKGRSPSDARERLRIIQDITELGAGFRIATHDLETARGRRPVGSAADRRHRRRRLRAVRRNAGRDDAHAEGRGLPERVEPEIKLQIPAFIPEDYVKDPNQRLIIYKKLTQPARRGEIDDIRAELVDRFGALPLAALYLLEVMRIRCS